MPIAPNALIYFQMAFLDSLGGLIEDAAKAPKGTLLTGMNDWQEDSFEVVAPQRAVSVELRAVICGKGRAWFKDLMFFG